MLKLRPCFHNGSNNLELTKLWSAVIQIFLYILPLQVGVNGKLVLCYSYD